MSMSSEQRLRRRVGAGNATEKRFVIGIGIVRDVNFQPDGEAHGLSTPATRDHESLGLLPSYCQ